MTNTDARVKFSHTYPDYSETETIISKTDDGRWHIRCIVTQWADWHGMSRSVGGDEKRYDVPPEALQGDYASFVQALCDLCGPLNFHRSELEASEKLRRMYEADL